MTTKFEDRIARLNAKHGTRTLAYDPAAQSSSSRSYDAAPPTAVVPAGRSFLKYVFVGLFVLIVLPVGAAMGTVFFARNGDLLAALGM
ncbi:hypothetical protein [Marivita sp. XM-24bin2]|jgi:hypothetical protein|uniref:hypothetical protein n=1 Tax=unclassified Marivita TaxID=2632480 RepID=UPI000D7B6145|nr:hypothetical protein [Marivita sp. XM-24bin2]MCR9108718.1 hypothetical protein [Paracoccaceae bacterium]PWL35907.1 MAG: hypothetical protein DCO97_06485 [Marivita sp. XM-24bin2]